MIEEVFDLFDTDGQQQLDEHELACAICAMGFCQTGYVEVLLGLAKWNCKLTPALVCRLPVSCWGAASPLQG